MNPTLFDGIRANMHDSIRHTISSLREYGSRYDHWVVAWSGGKDSTTCLTLVVYLIDSGQVSPPKSLTVCYADTRQELLPLYHVARDLRDELAQRNIACDVVLPDLDRRMWVYHTRS